jgi:hypothetical protein
VRDAHLLSNFFVFLQLSAVLQIKFVNSKQSKYPEVMHIAAADPHRLHAHPDVMRTCRSIIKQTVHSPQQ